MEEFTFKKKDILTTNICIELPCYPMPEYQLDILLKSKTQWDAWSDRMFSILGGTFLDIFANCLIAKKCLFDMKIELCVLVLSLLLGILFIIVDKNTNSEKSSLVKYCKDFYKTKLQ